MQDCCPWPTCLDRPPILWGGWTIVERGKFIWEAFTLNLEFEIRINNHINMFFLQLLSYSHMHRPRPRTRSQQTPQQKPQRNGGQYTSFSSRVECEKCLRFRISRWTAQSRSTAPIYAQHLVLYGWSAKLGHQCVTLYCANERKVFILGAEMHVHVNRLCIGYLPTI